MGGTLHGRTVERRIVPGTSLRPAADAHVVRRTTTLRSCRDYLSMSSTTAPCRSPTRRGSMPVLEVAGTQACIAGRWWVTPCGSTALTIRAQTGSGGWRSRRGSHTAPASPREGRRLSHWVRPTPQMQPAGRRPRTSARAPGELGCRSGGRQHQPRQKGPGAPDGAAAGAVAGHGRGGDSRSASGP